MKKISVLFLVSVLLSGCQALQNLADSIQKPSLSVTNVRVTDFALDEIELTYDVQVQNPNPVALQLLSYDYDLKINDNDFLKGDENKELRIESSGNSTFQIPMRLNFQELYNLFSGLRGKDEAGYQLAANLDFDLPVLGKTTLPLKKDGSLPMIKLPKINVSSLKLNNVNLSRADMVLNLNIDNPNGFGMVINALSYDLNVNGRNWIEGTDNTQVKIAKNNSGNISIPISLNILDIGTSVLQLLNNSNDVNYSLNGTLDVGATHPLLEKLKTNFSFDQTGDVPLIR